MPTFSDFEALEIRVKTIIKAEDFPEARKPAYKLKTDLGPLSIKLSSAQITELYKKENPIGSQVICVCDFPKKQIGPFISEVLVTGFVTKKGVVLSRPDRPVENGLKLR